jgi:hypothetical protein
MARMSRQEGIGRHSAKDRTTGKQPNVCFTLEIDRRPVLVLSAISLQSASKRTSEDWFMEELQRMRSGGKPIFRPGDERVVRPARPDEAARLELERSLDEVRGEDTKYAFAFLIPIDGDPN